MSFLSLDIKGKTPAESTPLLSNHPHALRSSLGRPRSYAAINAFIPKRRYRLKYNSRSPKLHDRPLCADPMANDAICKESGAPRDILPCISTGSTLVIPCSQNTEEGKSEAWRRLSYVSDNQLSGPSSPSVDSICPQKSFMPQCISLTLQNSGSVARDHLASERTFLAYMRTSLAIASSGVALVQLFTSSDTQQRGGVRSLNDYVRPLGASTIIMGLVVLVVGLVRYFTIQAALTKGYFPVARLITGMIAFALAALVTVTFALVLARKPIVFREELHY